MADKSSKNENISLYLKLGFLGLLVFLGLWFGFFGKKGKTQSSVLSAENEIKKSDNIENLKTTAQDVVNGSQDLFGQVLGESTRAVNDIVSQSINNVSNLLIDKTTQPIVDQIKKLPQSQQDEIKKNICN
ncbi:hypothetical protein M1328_02835 [Patescibacteria group bacterium]|nr:hypothetical protein [Patescibacteria group bacterium]